jgi:hypothetical protein
MGTFEDVVFKAKSVADAAGKKTVELVEITKLSLAISDAKKKIDKIFCEMGKIIYDAVKDDSDCTDEIKAKALIVDDHIVMLNQLNEKLAHIKCMKKCAACCADNQKVSVYCHKCGAKLD